MNSDYDPHRKQLLETLTTHRVYLNTMRTDISTAHSQVQLLSRNCNDIISMANSRLKQRLAENKVLSLEKISQLNTRCNQLCEDKEYSEAENKRLHNSMKQMESWYQQSEETNKNVISGLQGELNGMNFCCSHFHQIFWNYFPVKILLVHLQYF